MVPAYRVWQSNGIHHSAGSIPNPSCCGGWWPTGNTASHANVVEQTTDPAAQCAALGWEYYWKGFECVFTPGSPIIIDTDRDGYKLTSTDNGVRFDLNADGHPELIAWTRPDSDDAFLAHGPKRQRPDRRRHGAVR